MIIVQKERNQSKPHPRDVTLVNATATISKVIGASSQSEQPNLHTCNRRHQCVSVLAVTSVLCSPAPPILTVTSVFSPAAGDHGGRGLPSQHGGQCPRGAAGGGRCPGQRAGVDGRHQAIREFMHHARGRDGGVISVSSPPFNLIDKTG